MAAYADSYLPVLDSILGKQRPGVIDALVQDVGPLRAVSSLVYAAIRIKVVEHLEIVTFPSIRYRGALFDNAGQIHEHHRQFLHGDIWSGLLHVITP